MSAKATISFVEDKYHLYYEYTEGVVCLELFDGLDKNINEYTGGFILKEEDIERLISDLETTKQSFENGVYKHF